MKRRALNPPPAPFTRAARKKFCLRRLETAGLLKKKRPASSRKPADVQRDQPPLGAEAGIDFRLTRGVKSDYIIRHRRVAGSVHAGGAGGHPGHGQAGDRRPFDEQPLDGGRRDMSFNNVAIDDGRVARPEVGRNFIFRLGLQRIVVILRLDGELVFYQVPDPVATAPSSGRLKHLDDRGLLPVSRGGVGSGSGRAGRQQPEPQQAQGQRENSTAKIQSH